MHILDCGVTRTNMYGHYKYFIAYEYKNGTYRVYTKTDTNATMFDKLSETSVKQYNKICKAMARSEDNVHEFTNYDDYRQFMRKSINSAFV